MRLLKTIQKKLPKARRYTGWGAFEHESFMMLYSLRSMKTRFDFCCCQIQFRKKTTNGNVNRLNGIWKR